jgi:hypothetical protein
MTEQEIEQALIEKLSDLKYRYRQDKKNDILKAHGKGLMQQLFSSVEEAKR